MRRPWLSTWRRRGWPFLGSTLCLQLTSSTSSPKETSPLRYAMLATVWCVATCDSQLARYICRSTQLIIPQPTLIEICLCTQVACHLAKLFDSMAQLKFMEEDGQPTKEAIGMFSKDGEYVAFDKPCMCVGQVSSLRMHVCVYF